jgi:hypothetical protein
VPGWVPGDALDYLWCNLDFGLLWQTVNATLRALSPPDYMRFRSLLVIPGPTGPAGPEPIMDIERDVVSPLGQGIWAYTRPRPAGTGAPSAEQAGRQEAGSAPAPAGLEVAVGVGLKDGQALADGVERLRLAGVPPLSFLQPREFLGQRLYTLELGSWLLSFAPAGPGAGSGAPRAERPSRVDVLVAGIFRGLAEGDRLIFAQRLETLEDVAGRIASGPDAVLLSERLQRATRRTPTGPGTFLVIYNDLQGYARALGAYVRSRQEIPKWVGFSPLALLGTFDLQPELYPLDEDVLPYLDAVVTVGSRSEESVSVRLTVLAPPDFHPEGGD